MRKSKVLSKIKAGQVARICCLGHYMPFFPRHAAHFGYDGIWVDAEHRAFDAREAQSLIAFHHLADIDCIWRPPTLEKSGLYRLLEDGATGLMIPFVCTPGKAEVVVQSIKFPPLGNRGLDAAGLDADYMVNPKSFSSYSQSANQETLFIAQIETPQALENVENIAAVPGVDVLFIGPGDLSLRMQCAPGIRDPKMMSIQEKVAKASKKHGKAWGRPVGSGADAQVIKQMGGQFIILGSDFLGVYSHLRESSAQLDAALGEGTGAQGRAQVVTHYSKA